MPVVIGELGDAPQGKAAEKRLWIGAAQECKELQLIVIG